jgi:plastocyanin
MNVYVIAGAVFAGWAVLVSLLGMRGFPRGRGGERAAIGITVVLFVAAVGSAIADTTKVGERHGPELPEGEGGHGGGGEHEGGGAATPAPSPPSATAPSGAAPPPATAKTALALSADPTGNLRFDKGALDAKPGEVTITMTNPSPVPHDIALRGGGVNEIGDVVKDGGKSTVTATVQPGAYEFYCSVPGHEQGGMKGTLTVK